MTGTVTGSSRPENIGSVDRWMRACGDVSFTKKQSMPQKSDMGLLIPVASDTIPGQNRNAGCDKVLATLTTLHGDTEVAGYTNICLQKSNNNNPTTVPSKDPNPDLCRGASSFGAGLVLLI